MLRGNVIDMAVGIVIGLAVRSHSRGTAESRRWQRAETAATRPPNDKHTSDEDRAASI